MTGAMLPEGADAIVKVEDTDGGTETVEIRAGARVGTSVRPAGEDVKQGQVVLQAGMVVDARRVALLAATDTPTPWSGPVLEWPWSPPAPSWYHPEKRCSPGRSTSRTRSCSRPRSSRAAPWPSGRRRSTTTRPPSLRRSPSWRTTST